MPTQPTILEELAVRYGGCDPESPGDVARFYEQRFRKLSRRKRDRISFEILHRDGEVAPAAPLTQAEVRRLDKLFQIEEADAHQAELKPTVATIRRFALRQAEVSIAVFGAVGSVRLLPELIPVLGHHLESLLVVEVVLVAVGLVVNGTSLFYARRFTAGRDAVKGHRTKSK